MEQDNQSSQQNQISSEEKSNYDKAVRMQNVVSSLVDSLKTLPKGSKILAVRNHRGETLYENKNSVKGEVRT